MYIKKLLIVALMLSIITGMYATQLTINSKAGQSTLGIYVAPDTWCDSFKVNPCYAFDTEKTVLNTYSYIDFSPTVTASIDDILFSDVSAEQRYIINRNNIGTVLVNKRLPKVRFGVNVTTRFLYDNYRSYSHTYFMSYSRSVEYSLQYMNVSLGASFFTSWQLSDTLFFGVQTTVNAVLYHDFNSTYSSDNSYRITSPTDINITNKWGVMYKKDRHNFSFVIPFYVSYYSYDIEFTTVDSTSIGTSSRYNIDGKFEFLDDFHLNDTTFFRMNGTTGLSVSGNTNNNENYVITIPFVTAFSANHIFKDRIKFHYGSDMKFGLIIGPDPYPLTHDEGTIGYKNLQWGLFTGLEIDVVKQFQVRTGITSLVLDWHPEWEMSTIIFQTVLSTGFSILPIDRLSIDFGTTFISKGLQSFDEDIYEGDDYFAFNFELGIVYTF